MTARGDFLRHYSRDFAAALKKNGLEAELLDMDEPEKLAHAFAAMLPETAAAQRANAAMADFLKAHIYTKRQTAQPFRPRRLAYFL